MICYKIDVDRLIRIILLGKETLSEQRVHYTRYVSEYLLYVVTRGKLDLLINNDRVIINEGECYLFQRGDYQEPLSNADCEYYYVHFIADSKQVQEMDISEDEYMSLINQKRADNFKKTFYSLSCYDFMHVYLKRHTKISSKGLFDYIVTALKNNQLNEEGKIANKRFEISASFADILFKIESADCKRLDSRYTTVDRILDYIEQNYTLPLSSSDIERDLLINFDYANRLLTKTIGHSIIKHRNIVRINNAKAMIKTTNRPLSDIALAVGFESGYYFSRMFKRIVGISPSEYKQKILYGEMKGKDLYEND